MRGPSRMSIERRRARSGVAVSGVRCNDPDVGPESKPNRLAGETSPYLLQHAHNPVDWYPWSEEAFARARAENRPILLFVGYAACHWWHVMERESFEDENTARLMNELFVNVKVDREERPDVDDVYMKAVQMLTGRGGWPMTVFLTPDGKPFYGGTYFPPQDRHGLPGFPRLLEAVAHAYREKADDVQKTVAQLMAAMQRSEAAQQPAAALVPPLPLAGAPTGAARGAGQAGVAARGKAPAAVAQGESSCGGTAPGSRSSWATRWQGSSVGIGISRSSATSGPAISCTSRWRSS